MTVSNYIRLQTVPGVGPKKITAILTQLKQNDQTLDQFFAMPASEIADKFRLSAKLAEALAKSDNDVSEVVHKLQSKGIKILTRDSDDYPVRLIETLGEDTPPILYAWGNLELLNKPAVGFCGSRDVSAKGIEITRDAAHQIADMGWVVVSGHAKGVDTIAHQTALGRGSSTIVVLPEGIADFKLREELKKIADPRRILIVSEFAPNASWSVGNAMTRNKTIIGSSDVMILVESKLKGGTFEAGQTALKLRIPLYVADYQIPGKEAEGNVYFLGKGATALRKSRETSQANLSELVKTVRNKQQNIHALKSTPIPDVETPKQLVPYEPKPTAIIVYVPPQQTLLFPLPKDNTLNLPVASIVCS